jgi:hypothetical protein
MHLSTAVALLLAGRTVWADFLDLWLSPSAPDFSCIFVVGELYPVQLDTSLLIKAEQKTFTDEDIENLDLWLSQHAQTEPARLIAGGYSSARVEDITNNFTSPTESHPPNLFVEGRSDRQ